MSLLAIIRLNATNVDWNSAKKISKLLKINLIYCQSKKNQELQKC